MGALHVSWQHFLSSVLRCAVVCSLRDDVLLCDDLTCFFTISVFPCVALGRGKGCSWPLSSLDAASIHSQLQMQILRKGTLSPWSRLTLPSRYFLFWFWWLKKSFWGSGFQSFWWVSLLPLQHPRPLTSNHVEIRARLVPDAAEGYQGWKSS